MIKIAQFRYHSDNLAYVLYGEKEAMAIDGGAVDDILAFAGERNLDLRFAVNTHSHADHTSGTTSLVRRSGAQFVDIPTLTREGKIVLEKSVVKVYHTPGHTSDSLCFHAGHILVSGDTLFNATVGNCFSGDLKAFYQSIKHLMALPDDTRVYAGHDYVSESIAFARSLEPDNPELDRFLNAYDPEHVVSTIGDEKRVNPFVKFNDPAMTEVLNKMGLKTDSEYDRWESLMSLD